MYIIYNMYYGLDDGDYSRPTVKSKAQWNITSNNVKLNKNYTNCITLFYLSVRTVVCLAAEMFKSPHESLMKKSEKKRI